MFSLDCIIRYHRKYQDGIIKGPNVALYHIFSNSDTNWASTVQSYSDNNAE